MTVVETIIYIIEAVAVIVFLWLFYIDNKKYIYRVRIKEVVKGRTIQRTYKAKEYLDSEKVKWLKLRGEKDKTKRLITLPPEECLDLDFKAKKCCDAYRFHNNDIVWVKDNLQVGEVPVFVPDDNIKAELQKIPDEQKKKEFLSKWKKEQEIKWRKDNNIVAPYQPVTTNQRMGYFYNLKKAESRKNQDLKTLLLQNIPLIGLVVVILGLMALYGEIAKPVLEANQQMVTIATINKNIVDKLETINTNQQRIEAELKTISKTNQSIG